MAHKLQASSVDKRVGCLQEVTGKQRNDAAPPPFCASSVDRTAVEKASISEHREAAADAAHAAACQQQNEVITPAAYEQALRDARYQNAVLTSRLEAEDVKRAKLAAALRKAKAGRKAATSAAMCARAQVAAVQKDTRAALAMRDAALQTACASLGAASAFLTAQDGTCDPHLTHQQAMADARSALLAADEPEHVVAIASLDNLDKSFKVAWDHKLEARREMSALRGQATALQRQLDETHEDLVAERCGKERAEQKVAKVTSALEHKSAELAAELQHAGKLQSELTTVHNTLERVQMQLDSERTKARNANDDAVAQLAAAYAAQSSSGSESNSSEGIQQRLDGVTSALGDESAAHAAELQRICQLRTEMCVERNAKVRAEARVEDLTAAAAALHERIASLEVKSKASAGLLADLAAAQRDATAAQERCTELDTQLAEAMHCAAALRDRVAALAAECEGNTCLQADLQAAKNEAVTAHKRCTERERQLTAQQNALQECRGVLSATEQTLVQQCEASKYLQLKLVSANNSCSQVKTALQELGAAAAQQKSKLEAAHAELSQVNAAIAITRDELVAAQDDKEEAELEVAELRNKVTAAELGHQELRRSLEQCKAQFAAEKYARVHDWATAQEARQQLECAQAARETDKATIARLHNQLEAAQKGHALHVAREQVAKTQLEEELAAVQQALELEKAKLGLRKRDMRPSHPMWRV